MISNVMMLLIEKLAADGRVSEAEAVDVRRAIFPDGAVSRAEAEALFVLNERVGDDDQTWNDCFVEAICDHLMLADQPEGHVTDAGAEWLERRIGGDGVLERRTELELVLKLMEKAQSCPARLHEFARKMVSRAVLEGKGYEGRDPRIVAGQIGEAEVGMIRRVLFASAGAGNIAVTREEAEWLFEIDEATEGHAHVAAWRELFVSAIMNHLFGAGPSSLLNRQAMIDRANWLGKPAFSGGAGGFLSRVLGGVTGGGVQGYMERAQQNDALGGQYAHLKRREVETHVAEALDTAEAAWLVTRMRADGRRTANEQALVDAVKAAKGDGALKSA